MKELTDGNEVSARSFYYLLDFNDRDDWVTMFKMFGKKKLSELTLDEYKSLFKVATEKEFNK